MTDRLAGFRKLPDGVRKCGSCGEVKDKSEFYRDTTRASGFNSRCKICQNAYIRERRKDTSVDHLSARRKWANENRERLREQDRQYKASNRDKMRLKDANRRARKKALPDTLTETQLDEILDRFNGKCALCNEVGDALDHFIPIATGYGGTTKENIIPLCSKMNSSKKKDYNPFEWFETYLNDEQIEAFSNVVIYLAGLNGLSVDEYREFVSSCFEENKQ